MVRINRITKAPNHSEGDNKKNEYRETEATSWLPQIVEIKELKPDITGSEGFAVDRVVCHVPVRNETPSVVKRYGLGEPGDTT